MTRDDADLVAEAQQDSEAFALLYRRYVAAVYRYCYRHLGSQEDAEDATSQIFTQALSALTRLGDQPFRAWLFTIAHNVVTDVYRARGRSRLRPSWESRSDLPEVADPDPTPEQQFLAAEQGQGIRTLLAHLPDESRQVVELRLAGLTDMEISRVQCRSHVAVRVAQHRAVVRLRALRLQVAIDGSERPDA